MGRRQLPEASSERHLFGVTDGLSTEEDHLPAQQRFTYAGDDRLIEIRRQVDAVDLRTYVPGNRSNIELRSHCCRAHCTLISHADLEEQG